MTKRNHSEQAVVEWVRETFGEGFLNDRERAFRFIEEAIELVQAIGLTRQDVDRVTEHVFGRPEGDPYDEIGGVVITLEALCGNLQTDMIRHGNDEWDRISSLPRSRFDAAVDRKEAAGIQHNYESAVEDRQPND